MIAPGTSTFERVIVGVDGRAGGRDAIALARLLVARDGRLTLVHVHAGESTRAGIPVLATDQGAHDDALALLERERAAAAVEGDTVAIAAPSVGRGLHDLAEALGAELLVVGSCARGFAGRVLLGNDTRAALSGAPCAVAVAPLGYDHDLGRLHTVGVGFDGSPESEAALGLARAIAAGHDARVRALAVVQIPASPWAGFAGSAWGTALDEVMAGTRRQLEGLDGVAGEAVIGIAGEELAAFGDHVGLLVVGSRGYGPVRRMMFGSTSEYLAGHARCPLLVLPRAVAQGAAT